MLLLGFEVLREESLVEGLGLGGRAAAETNVFILNIPHESHLETGSAVKYN